MTYLSVVDYNPQPEATDVATNALIWIKFDSVINWSTTLSKYYMSIVETDTYEAVAGTLSRSTDTLSLVFTITNLLKPSTKYTVYVYNGTTGPSSGTGSSTIYLQDVFTFSFTTGTTTGTGDDTEEPAPEEDPDDVTVPSTNLEVLSVDPADNSSNQSRSKTIKIYFTAIPALPSGKTWDDYITISKVGVLG